MSGKSQEKISSNKKKSKNSAAKDQAAPPAQSSRESTPKPSSTSRKPSEAPAKPAATAYVPQVIVEEPHVPVNGFNAAEIEAMLATGAADGGELYNPDKPAQKAAGAWAAKPSTMLNGKDFWVELRKQMTEVMANGGVAKTEKKKQGG